MGSLGVVRVLDNLEVPLPIFFGLFLEVLVHAAVDLICCVVYIGLLDYR